MYGHHSIYTSMQHPAPFTGSGRRTDAYSLPPAATKGKGPPNGSSNWGLPGPAHHPSPLPGKCISLHCGCRLHQRTAPMPACMPHTIPHSERNPHIAFCALRYSCFPFYENPLFRTLSESRFHCPAYPSHGRKRGGAKSTQCTGQWYRDPRRRELAEPRTGYASCHLDGAAAAEGQRQHASHNADLSRSSFDSQLPHLEDRRLRRSRPRLLPQVCGAHIDAARAHAAYRRC